MGMDPTSGTKNGTANCRGESLNQGRFADEPLNGFGSHPLDLCLQNSLSLSLGSPSHLPSDQSSNRSINNASSIISDPGNNDPGEEEGFLDPLKATLDASIDASLDCILPASPNMIHAPGNIPDRIYPEYLLHHSHKANKYYTALQKYSRQFLDEEQTNITQFSHTNLSQVMANTISDWDETGPERSSLEQKGPLCHSRTNAANSLFAWSSGDKYIAARKLELRRRNQDKSSEEEAAQPSPTKESSPTPLSAPQSKFTSSQRLHSVIEKESNKFIQDRIEVIKAHHMRKASERISQRKRDDHEMHLRRLMLKEEKYAKALKAAIASQNTRRNTGFFGSLFGNRPISNSFTLDLLDTDTHVPVAAAKDEFQSPLVPKQSTTSSPVDPAVLDSMENKPGSPDVSSPRNSAKQTTHPPEVLDESSLNGALVLQAPAESLSIASIRNESADLLAL